MVSNARATSHVTLTELLPCLASDGVFLPGKSQGMMVLPLHCRGWSTLIVTVPEMDSPGLYTTLFLSNVISNSCSFPILVCVSVRFCPHLCASTTSSSSSSPLLPCMTANFDQVAHYRYPQSRYGTGNLNSV